MYSWKLKVPDRKRSLSQEGYASFDEALRALYVKLIYLLRKHEVDPEEYVYTEVLKNESTVWQSDEIADEDVDNIRMELED